MNVLVTGGTGFVGRAVVRELQGARQSIHLLARDARSPRVQEFAEKHSANVRQGDVLNAKSLTDACAGIDAVIHLVGIISEVGSQTFESVHTEGTRNLIEAARRAGAKRFVHMSALGTKPNAVARYHQSKWAAEELVRARGLNWTIFRPSIIYGPGDGFVNLFAKIARRSPAVPLIGGGHTRFQPVPVEAVAKAFVGALSKPEAINQTYDLCGPETLTVKQIVETVLQVTGRRRLMLPLPFGVARFQAALLEYLFARCLHKAPPLNRDQVLMLQEDNVGDGSTAAREFKLQMPEFRKGISAYLS
ncbi:MAG TPA: complex I NDUFA9 subunit family protein [Candidatus Paceibacterota bacterium]|nr:complex I NDUFA9 subunit family protein [Candidatus Paceibacterota bacterium]